MAIQVKDEPDKMCFRVSSGKFFDFIIRYWRIKIDLSKIKVIRELPFPKNFTKLQSLQGWLAYMRQFISNLFGRCQLLTKLTKKGIPFVWDDECQQALDKLKEYLQNPPILWVLIKGKPLILYITVMDASLSVLFT